MKLLFTLLFVTLLPLFASLEKKSAMVYYGEHISYPMVGIHDYVIVQPSHINTDMYGFKTYSDRLYAYVSIGEIDRDIEEYEQVKKEWILAENRAWSSDVLDLKNPEYIEFLFESMIEPQRKRGFKNFFFDTLDSYQLASKTAEDRAKNEAALVAFIKEFHKRYPDSKLVINRGFEIIDEVYDSIDAVLFESYYRGVGGAKLAYKPLSDGDREWLDIYLDKIKKYKKDIICVDYLDAKDIKQEAPALVEKLEEAGFIPYVANRELNIYGTSSKNAIKREVFTLIDEHRLDRTLLEAHQYGGTVLEYMGYIQKLHDINDGYPTMDEMRHYAGVIIWLQDFLKKPKPLMKWVVALKKNGIKVLFANNFGFTPTTALLKPLGISVYTEEDRDKKIVKIDSMMNYEIDAPLSIKSVHYKVKNAKRELLTYKNSNGSLDTPAAITEWGGYAVEDAFMFSINNDNIWVVDPFKLFKEALGLEDLIVPDVTTENGRRLLFTHIDGDGIMNRVEGDFGYYSGDVILNKILKVYKIPHSVSVIGAEIWENGLYPKISPELIKIANDMYALENVEPATHTFTHPFFWDKIQDGDLDKHYRLRPKDYDFSLEYELGGQIDMINAEFTPKHKAKAVFWSGDCAPRENALKTITKENILNINGGDTVITATFPWLSGIAPLGLQRGEYVQVYTGAQNENVFTNDWLGPFWGFKRVVQTFKLTNSPRRFKPIDIYYHLYSGSKEASLRALEYVFDWAVAQKSMPIFTSEYIPKVMNYYVVSMAHEGNEWLFEGMHDIRTIRVERREASIDLNTSATVVGVNNFEGHTYLNLDQNSSRHTILLDDTDAYKLTPYLSAANGKLTDYSKSEKSKKYAFEGHMPLELEFYLPESCKLKMFPKAYGFKRENEKAVITYRKAKAAKISIDCR